LDGSRQRCKIRDLLMRTWRWRDWQTCLTASLLRGSRACSRTELRDWNGSSDTMESALFNDWSKICTPHKFQLSSLVVIFISFCMHGICEYYSEHRF
jgi:hypothetical protein